MEALDLRPPYWRVAGDMRDHSAFFRNLPLLVPADGILILEGGRHPRALRAFLAAHALPPLAESPRGTSWPTQQKHCLPTTEAFLRNLADQTEHCAAPEVSEHLYVYRNQDMVLQWFDAFSEALYVSQLLPTVQLERFCAALGLSYVAEG